MTILSTVCTKLLCTNAHLGRRVAAHHYKVYIRCFRNGIAILDSDKTLICLRNALHFIGSLIRKKGRSFFLKTNHFFIYSIMEKMGSCINESQWKIGAFLTNSYANPKKFRSRKNQINFGLNQQPDCVVILNPDRKSSVILEADRSLIPIASFVDSTIPWESYKKITYPIPANDPIPLVYLFRNSITKTVMIERKKIKAIRVDPHFTLSTGMEGGKRTYSTSSYPKEGHWSHKIYTSIQKKGILVFLFWPLLMAMVCAASAIFVLVLNHPSTTPETLFEFLGTIVSWLGILLNSMMSSLASKLSYLLKTIVDLFDRGYSHAMGLGVGPEKGSPCSEGFTHPGEETFLRMEGDAEFWDSLPPIETIPPENLPEGGDASTPPTGSPSHRNPVGSPSISPADEGGSSGPRPPTPELPPGQLERLRINLSLSRHPYPAVKLSNLADEIYEKKNSILSELRRLTGPVNGQILFGDLDSAGAALRNPKNGEEFHPKMLDLILQGLQQEEGESKHFSDFINSRIGSIPNEALGSLRVGDLPQNKLNSLNQAKFVRWPGDG